MKKTMEFMNVDLVKTQTKEIQSNMTPNKALAILMAGNQRFQNNLKANRDLLKQVEASKDGQYPFAVILSCIDSRVSSELIFDQGVGDIFSIRIAGNFVNEDILGSMEFACKVAGSKLIVVLGHSKCGAIKGVCDGVKLGNLTTMLSKLKPAVDAVEHPAEKRNSQDPVFVEKVTHTNVSLTIENIKKQSPVLKELLDDGEIDIVGAMYDVENGKVAFL